MKFEGLVAFAIILFICKRDEMVLLVQEMFGFFSLWSICAMLTAQVIC